MTIEQFAVSAEPFKAADGGLPLKGTNRESSKTLWVSVFRPAFCLSDPSPGRVLRFSQNAGDSRQGRKMSMMILVAAFEFAGQLIGGLRV